MINAGNFDQVALAALTDRLTRDDGPWAIPLNATGQPITHKLTALVPHRLVPQDDAVSTYWQAAPIDCNRYVSGIGLAATYDGDILLTIAIEQHLDVGETIRLHMPWPPRSDA